jgi:hypothetical protein
MRLPFFGQHSPTRTAGALMAIKFSGPPAIFARSTVMLPAELPAKRIAADRIDRLTELTGINATGGDGVFNALTRQRGDETNRRAEPCSTEGEQQHGSEDHWHRSRHDQLMRRRDGGQHS